MKLLSLRKPDICQLNISNSKLIIEYYIQWLIYSLTFYYFNSNYFQLYNYQLFESTNQNESINKNLFIEV
jgi:hypothetical protein